MHALNRYLLDQRLDLVQNVCFWPLLMHLFYRPTIVIVELTLRAVKENLQQLLFFQWQNLMESWDGPDFRFVLDYGSDVLMALLIRSHSAA